MFTLIARATVLFFFLVGHGYADDHRSLTEDEKKIVEQVQNNLSQTLSGIEKSVNINSGTMNFSGVKAVGELMIEKFKLLGFKTQWLEGSAFNRAGHVVAQLTSKNPSAKKILMIGHLDTVFATQDSFQQYQQLSNTEISGPGIVDMKGGNAIIIAALSALQKANLLSELSIRVVLTGDEESSGRPLALSKKAIVDGGKWADIAMGFEDGDGDINTAVIARRGAVGWTLNVTGKPAHSSQIFRDDIGYGAIYETARILTDFRTQLAKEENLTFNPGLIAGGTTVDYEKNQSTITSFGKVNVIAQTTVVIGDIRAISSKQLANAKQVMQKIVEKNLAHTNAELIFAEGYPAMAPTVGNYKLLALYNQISYDLGYNKVMAVNPRKAGAADISFAADYVDMALDGLGLMGRGGHTKGEVADLTTLQKNIEKAAILLHRIAVNNN